MKLMIYIHLNPANLVKFSAQSNLELIVIHKSKQEQYYRGDQSVLYFTFKKRSESS